MKDDKPADKKKDITLLQLQRGDEEDYPVNQRDYYYSALVRSIAEDNQKSRWMKTCFFILVCAIFLLMCSAGIVVVFMIANKDNTSIADIGVVISAFGTTLGSIIVLPQIIAKHLFPEDFEKVRLSFMGKCHNDDNKIAVEDDES